MEKKKLVTYKTTIITLLTLVHCKILSTFGSKHKWLYH